MFRFRAIAGVRSLIVIAIIALLAACADDESDAQSPDDATLRIVATTTQASDLARILTANVPGVLVTPLMGPGVDPHLYQPTEGDIAAMNGADVVVYNGLNLEGQFDAVFEALGRQGTIVFALADSIDAAGFVIETGGGDDSAVATPDPHVWFDPRNWILATDALARELAAVDPDNADAYRRNASDYTEQLEALFTWGTATMASVPATQRRLVTSHDAFQYFGDAFGWEVAAIQGISTEDEAGVGDIQATIDLVVERGVPALFVESSIPPDTIDAVIEAIASAGGTVRRGVRELHSDAMGAPGTFEGTYVGMIASNIATIVVSYACAGVDATVAAWPAGLEPTIPAEVLNATCDE